MQWKWKRRQAKEKKSEKFIYKKGQKRLLLDNLVYDTCVVRHMGKSHVSIVGGGKQLQLAYI